MRANSLLNRGTKSVLNPSAQLDNLCGFVSVRDTSSSRLDSQLASLEKLDFNVFIVCRLQVLFGLRISEVLCITGDMIDRHGRIIIKGLKKSNDRLVIDSTHLSWYLNKKPLRTARIFQFNRFYVYRCYKSVGIHVPSSGGKKGFCTHIPRHHFIKEMNRVTADVSQTALLVGHKSVKSTQNYLKSKVK